MGKPLVTFTGLPGKIPRLLVRKLSGMENFRDQFDIAPQAMTGLEIKRNIFLLNRGTECIDLFSREIPPLFKKADRRFILLAVDAYISEATCLIYREHKIPFVGLTTGDNLAVVTEIVEESENLAVICNGNGRDDYVNRTLATLLFLEKMVLEGFKGKVFIM